MRKSKNLYFYHIFVFPGEAPVAITQNVAWMKRQFSACQTLAACTHLSSTVSQLFEPELPKNRRFHAPQPTFFVSPGDAPAIITQYVARMEIQFNACQTPRSMYPSIFNSFPVIRTANAKKSPFSRTAAHIFVSPGDAPTIITQYVAQMEKQFNACQTPRSIYLSIFNSFRVIRCLSQCVSPKIAIFTTFLFPLGTPLGQSR